MKSSLFFLAGVSKTNSALFNLGSLLVLGVKLATFWTESFRGVEILSYSGEFWALFGKNSFFGCLDLLVKGIALFSERVFCRGSLSAAS